MTVFSSLFSFSAVCAAYFAVVLFVSSFVFDIATVCLFFGLFGVGINDFRRFLSREIYEVLSTALVDERKEVSLIKRLVNEFSDGDFINFVD